MPAFWPILVTGAHLVLAASGVPALDVGPTCRAAAAAAVGEGRDVETCERQERRARDKVAAAWEDYTAEQREHCRALTGMGGAPSYVELLTCLETAKAADQLPDFQLNGQLDDIVKQ